LLQGAEHARGKLGVLLLFPRLFKQNRIDLHVKVQ
jgi:hypothetical protein